MNSLPPYSLSACLSQLFTSRLTDIFNTQGSVDRLQGGRLSKDRPGPMEPWKKLQNNFDRNETIFFSLGDKKK